MVTSFDRRLLTGDLESSSQLSSPGNADPKRCKIAEDESKEGKENNSEEEGSKVAAKETPVVLKVDRERFERILITMEMMNDHLPDGYLKLINRL